MDMTLFDIPAVMTILGVVGFVLVRAFGSSRTDRFDMFVRRNASSQRGRG